MSASLTISQLCDMYLDWARSYYRKHGQPTRTAENIRDAMRELRSVCGSELVSDFSSKRLRDVQRAMAESGRLTAGTVNDRVKWIKAMFDWAEREEIEGVDELLTWKLSRVRSIQPGRFGTKESKGVSPVDWETVCSTLAHAPTKLYTMVEVQWHTGMRPGEVVQLCHSAINTDGDPWIYVPPSHKTEHHQRVRLIPLGPMAQSALRTWMERVPREKDWLFEGLECGRWPTGKPMKRLSYAQAIRRVNERHGIPHWHPNQIRHAVATHLEQTAGIEAARVILGHASATTTRIYAEVDKRKAIELMRELG